MNRPPLQAARERGEAHLKRRRAWQCTGVFAFYCPLCGDCTCTLGPSLGNAACPLHSRSSEHGTRSEMVA